MSIGENIKRLRERYGLTQSELGKIAGVTDKAVSTWEADIKTPRMGAFQKMADYFGIDKSEIIDGKKAQTPSPKPIPAGYNPIPAMSALPVIGSVACGQPILAEQNIDGYASAPENWHADFVLVCKGRSMEPKINDGDLVAIRTGVDVENGQIAAVRIDDEATLKKVYFFPDRIMLQPINDEFEVYTFEGEDMNRVFIEGKAVGLCRSI